jgi:hypothetical protein
MNAGPIRFHAAQVVAVCTNTDWRTQYDVMCSYAGPGPNAGEEDVFSFAIPMPHYVSDIQLAVRYTVDGEVGDRQSRGIFFCTGVG